MEGSYTQSQTKIFSLVYYLEQGSAHPIAQAFAQATLHLSDLEPIEMTSLKVHVGEGVSGYHQGRYYQLGGAKWTGQPSQAGVRVFLVEDGQCIACFSIRYAQAGC